MVGWLERLVGTIWPARCVSCHAPGGWWCEACDSRVTRSAGPIPRHSDVLTGILAGADYRPPLPAAIKALKYRHTKVIAGDLVRYLLPPLERIAADSALLVPVPLHPDRQRKRGYNQSALLARLAATATGIPYREGLRRVRATPTQTGLRRAERFKNVAGAFAWSGPNLSAKTIVLIDDVITTGATLEAAGLACRDAGAAEVWGVALSHRPLN